MLGLRVGKPRERPAESKEELLRMLRGAGTIAAIRILGNAPPALQGDKDCVLAAVRESGRALQYADHLCSMHFPAGLCVGMRVAPAAACMLALCSVSARQWCCTAGSADFRCLSTSSVLPTGH